MSSQYLLLIRKRLKTWENTLFPLSVFGEGLISSLEKGIGREEEVIKQ